jgi:hypothetical protein
MRHKTFATLLTFIALAAPMAAQTPKAQALLMALLANSKQVASYHWKQKTTIVRKGDPVGYSLEAVHIDASGQPQRILLDKSPEKHLGPIASRKAAGVKQDIQEIMRAAAQYANPRVVADSIRKGEIWEGPNGLRVQARAVLNPADDVVLTVNGSTFLVSQAEIRTRHEGEPVTIQIDYRKLPNGPNVLSRMTVRIPEDGIVVNVDSFDFLHPAL